jgi:precorrin-6A/cobalt-precorrin-6A reductase
MILVLSGTRDGSEIIKLLRKKGHKVLVTTTTSYGSKLAREAGASETIEGKLDRDAMFTLLNERKINAVIDATHPFAQEASKNAIFASKKAGINYLRYERKNEKLPESNFLHQFDSFEEGAVKSVALGEVIFSTIGSNQLKPFVEAVKKEKKRIIVKVLPTCEAIDKCSSLGLDPKDIVALQGAGDVELNKALLREYNADVMVTKESGATGGEDVKIKAALSLKIPTVIITRPKLEYPYVVREYVDVITWLENEN